jgi:hypothetical protein
VPSASVPKLVWAGADRLRIFSELCDIWDTAVAERQFGVVVIRGSSGSGRSTVLHAWYQHCAADQTYWPQQLDPADEMAPREFVAGRRRSALFDLRPPLPPLVAEEVDPRWSNRRPQPPRLDFFWWGLTARRGRFAALDGERQIRAHLTALTEAVLRADRLTRTRLKAALDVACLLGPLLPLAQPLALSLDVINAIKDAPDVARETWSAFRSQEAALASARTSAAGRTVSVDGSTAAIELVQNDAIVLARIATVLPFAIAIDDAENLDPTTIGMLSTMVRQGGAHGLLVLAVNTDLEQAVGPTGGNDTLASWLLEETRLGRVTTLTLDNVPNTELAELALHWLAPGNPDPERLGAVIEASKGRPGRLSTLLASPKVVKALTDSTTTWPADLHAALANTATIADAAFAALPDDQRDTLAELALHGPTTHHDLLPPDLTAERLDRASSTGWIRLEHDRIDFRSTDLWQAAAYTDRLTDDEEGAVLAHLSRAVTAARDDGRWQAWDPGLAESILTALVAGSGTDVVDPDHLAELARLRRLTGRTNANNDLISQLTVRLSQPAPPPKLIVATVEGLLDAGHEQHALDVAWAEYDRLSAKYGSDAAATIPALDNLAAVSAEIARRHSGQPDAAPLFESAVDLYERLLHIRVRHNPASDRRIPDTELSLAHLQADYYHYPVAVAHSRNAASRYRAILGADHPDTLTTRGWIGTWTGRAGYPDDARDLYAALLRDLERVLGPDYPTTLAGRGNLASWTGWAGDPARARDLFAALLPDHDRVLGPDHPDTLTTRENLASWMNDLPEP